MIENDGIQKVITPAKESGLLKKYGIQVCSEKKTTTQDIQVWSCRRIFCRRSDSTRYILLLNTLFSVLIIADFVQVDSLWAFWLIFN